MEGNISMEKLPASADLAATQSCCDELTRSSPDLSSLTRENSKDVFHQNTDASPGKCTTWTNEKHNLYLDHLETSFVEQLQQSMGLLVWCSEKNTRESNLSQKLPAHTCNASEQFTVVRDGRWQKINFERNRPQVGTTAADSKTILKNPWIRHFRRADKSCTIPLADQEKINMASRAGMYLKGKRTSCDRFASSLEQLPISHPCHHDSIGSSAEVSDQNFVDEQKSGSSSMGKRLKTGVPDALSQDQVVPSVVKLEKEISPNCYGSSKTGEQVRQDWNLAKLESVVCPESDLKSFLRKS